MLVTGQKVVVVMTEFCLPVNKILDLGLYHTQLDLKREDVSRRQEGYMKAQRRNQAGVNMEPADQAILNQEA